MQASLDRNYPNYLPAKLMQAQIDPASGDTKAALQTTTQLLGSDHRKQRPTATLRRRCWLTFGSTL